MGSDPFACVFCGGFHHERLDIRARQAKFLRCDASTRASGSSHLPSEIPKYSSLTQVFRVRHKSDLQRQLLIYPQFRTKVFWSLMDGVMWPLVVDYDEAVHFSCRRKLTFPWQRIDRFRS